MPPYELEKLGVLDFGARVIRKPFRKKLLVKAVREALGLSVGETSNLGTS